jgi:Uma2 family endonuclease
MAAIPKQKMTLEEYLEFDTNTEGRFEYFDGEVFEMSGGSPEHSLLSSRTGFLLNSKLLPKGCSVYSSDVMLKVPAMPPYRYADVSALCGQPDYEETGNQRLLTNPILVVEVLSDTTEKFDKGDKFKAYKSIESLQEYLLISQEKRFVTLFTKYNAKFWLQSEYESGETLKLESLDIELSVDEIYEGII